MFLQVIGLQRSLQERRAIGDDGANGRNQAVEQVHARSIFRPATGFIRRGGFDWTCNPYVGFGAGTGTADRQLLAERRGTEEDYQRCGGLLRKQRQVYETEAIFSPPPT